MTGPTAAAFKTKTMIHQVRFILLAARPQKKDATHRPRPEDPPSGTSVAVSHLQRDTKILVHSQLFKVNQLEFFFEKILPALEFSIKSGTCQQHPTLVRLICI